MGEQAKAKKKLQISASVLSISSCILVNWPNLGQPESIDRHGKARRENPEGKPRQGILYAYDMTTKPTAWGHTRHTHTHTYTNMHVTKILRGMHD